MKTYRQFIEETTKKLDKDKDDTTKTKYHTGWTVFGQHSVPLTDRMQEEYNGSQFQDTTSKVADLENHYKLDKEDKKVVSSYTLQSAHVNESLLHKHLNPDDHFHAADHERYHGHMVNDMDRFLGKRKTKSDMHVYTGAGFSPERFKEKDHKENQPIKVHLPAFTSTSIHQHIAEDFAKQDTHKDAKGGEYAGHKHMIKIHVPEGSHGAYIGKHSQFPTEHEFVLPRDSKIHVHPKPEIHHPLGVGKTPIAVWHAKLVHGENE